MNEPYSYEQHSPTKMKSIPWLVCKYCGLVYLKNELTSWAIKMGCNSSDHKSHKEMVERLTGK